jgi:hypothetical protein
MKKYYYLSLLQVACFLLVSLLLQSCGGTSNLPIQTEEKPLLTTTIEQEEDQVQRLIGQQEGNTLPTIMPELWQEIFSYLDFKDVLSARVVNSDWNKLITGYREAGVIGLESRPFHIIDTRGWTRKKKIDFRKMRSLKGETKIAFRRSKSDKLTPATIPSFAFYRLMGYVNNLREEFWPYLKGSNVHTVNLSSNHIFVQGGKALAKHLQGTNVHTLILSSNHISAKGAKGFAKHLQGTQVHTVNLRANGIGPEGAEGFAKHLKGTQVHTVNLGWNDIGNRGAMELAGYLQETNVHTIELGANGITYYMKKLLQEKYPHIKWIF